MSIVDPSPAELEKAATLLSAGKLVAFPTETVYGLGGDATNDRAIASIYEAKGRPQFNPLIVHVAAAKDLDGLVLWNDMARTLAERFWPGPLTMVLPRAPECPVSLLVSAGLDTLAVRVPAHPVALDLLRAVGRPIAAPSANPSGKLSPTTPEHVAESLGDKVDMILDGGRTVVGVESTVLDLTPSRPVILRPGGVTREQLQSALGMEFVSSQNVAAAHPKSPGMLSSHYAPRLPLRLNATKAADDEALLAFGPDENVKGGALRLNLSAKGDLGEAAANLFSMLRRLDQAHLRSIAVMPIPSTGLGVAINDRLGRAAAPRD
ncbi:MAG: threonylcarbamoyl-AMP synthase [Alphaproteobacteria bacterium]|nr:threonylcarbamoyl-AMP synthase [Alphaproteobacteria bacterium]